MTNLQTPVSSGGDGVPLVLVPPGRRSTSPLAGLELWLLQERPQAGLVEFPLDSVQMEPVEDSPLARFPG
jgi:hypothetical protein